MGLSDGFHDVPAGKLAMVVTWLETRKAQMRGLPLPEGLEFAELRCDISTYRDLFRRVGQDWLWFGRLVMDDAELSAILSDPHVQLFAMFRNGKPEALLELDFRTKGACELAYFGLTPELIGTGAGGYLMDRAMEAAFASDISRFHLHTCTLDSPQALGFYLQSGFVPYKRSVEVADDPRHLGIYPEGTGNITPLL